MIVDDVFEFVKNFINQGSVGCVEYRIDGTHKLGIMIERDKYGEPDSYAFTMIRNGRPTVGACGTGPVDDFCLRTDIRTVLSCGLRADEFIKKDKFRFVEGTGKYLMRKPFNSLKGRLNNC